MFCGKCGKKVEDGTRFCPYCGAPASSGQDVILNALGNQAGPVPAAPAAPSVGAGTAPPLVEAPNPGNKRRGVGVLAGVGAAAVLLIVLAAVMFSGLLGGAKGTLGKAVAKSMNAYQSASDAIGMPDLQKLYESKKVRADMSFQLKGFSDELTYYTPELEMLEGFGFSVSAGYDLQGRKLDFSATASYGSAGLLTVWCQVDDEVLSFGCPELLDNKSYGINTETLGVDLDRLGADMPEEMKDMGFNLFDIMETFSRPVEVDKSANQALTDAIEVEKAGKSTIDVNGHSMDCTGYHVVVPEEAMLAYLDALEDAYEARGLEEAALDLLGSMGLSESELAEVRSGISAAGSGTDALREAVRTIGDVELEVYVSDGYVVAVSWEEEIQGTQLSLSANFGGGENYADDIMLALCVDDMRLRYDSTGNHGTENGEYTDSSSVTIQAGGISYTIRSELEYRPKDASDNLSWTVKGDGFSVAMEGQLTTAKDSLFVDLDKLSVTVMGTEMVRLGATYAIKPYDAPAYSTGELTMLASMSEADFENLAYDVTVNAQNWLMGLVNDVPELAELFW